MPKWTLPMGDSFCIYNNTGNKRIICKLWSFTCNEKQVACHMLHPWSQHRSTAENCGIRKGWLLSDLCTYHKYPWPTFPVSVPGFEGDDCYRNWQVDQVNNEPTLSRAFIPSDSWLDFHNISSSSRPPGECSCHDCWGGWGSNKTRDACISSYIEFISQGTQITLWALFQDPL